MDTSRGELYNPRLCYNTQHYDVIEEASGKDWRTSEWQLGLFYVFLGSHDSLV